MLSRKSPLSEQQRTVISMLQTIAFHLKVRFLALLEVKKCKKKKKAVKYVALRCILGDCCDFGDFKKVLIRE